MPIALALGTNSRINSSCFAASTSVKRLIPVALPLGRLRLATRPILMGSSTLVNTIGIVAVARLAASAGVGPPLAMITAT
jgi:hypothetical protein